MLRGSIDVADRTRILGWARSEAFADVPVSLLVTVDGRLLERVVANRYRPDLARAQIGDGTFSFEVRFNPPLLPTRSWLIHVRSEADGEDVPGSPVRIEPATDFDEAAQAAFAAAIAGFATAEELEQRIGFVDAQRDWLLQRRAALQADKAGRATGGGAAQGAGRILVIDEEMPEPDRDGGATALLSHMRSMQRLGLEVSLATPGRATERGLAALEQMGVTGCDRPYYGSVEEVLQFQAGRFTHVYLHRLSMAACYMALARLHQPKARLIYSVADLHHVRLARQAEYESRPELLAVARQLRDQEFWAASRADAVLTHSGEEARVLRQYLPAERVHVVAWSVPCTRRGVGFADRAGLAFIGNFNHAPNLAAAIALRDEILPIVHRENAAIGCRLVGANLPRALQGPQPGLAVMGRVEDLGAVFDGVRLTVAPLGFGAGLKAKVLESLAAGIPCVCSPIAAEGLELPPALGELVMSDAAAMAGMIVRLHEDAAYNARMAREGRRWAAARFSEAATDEALRRALGMPEAAAVQA